MKHIFSKKNKALLAELVRTDFKLRYQGSVLGYAWSLLRPMFLFLILYLVFAVVFKAGKDVPHFPIYLLLGIVMWNFFAEVTSQGLGSIVGRGDLIRKIRIPRWIIVVSSSISALINLGLNLVIVGIFMVFNHVGIMKSIIFLPFILLEVYVLALGLAFFLSAKFVKYRDVSYIWEVLSQALLYLTPILWSLTLINKEFYRKVIFINPIGQALQDARYSLIAHDPRIVTAHSVWHSYFALLLPISVVIVIFIVGIITFKRESSHFAEDL